MDISRCAENDSPRSLRSHFLELRARIVVMLLVLVLCTAVLLPFTQELFGYFSSPLIAALPDGALMLSVGVAAPVLTPLKLVLFCAFCLSLPVIVYEIFAFVAPGLYRREKMLAIPFVLSSVLMFALGVIYCYFVVFSFLFKFIAAFAPDSINYAPDIDAYLSFCLHMFFAFGLAFEEPLAVAVLGLTGMVSLQGLKKFRRYMIVVSFAVAAVITPPDVLSQLLLALPVIFLYELGLVIVRVGSRRSSAPGVVRKENTADIRG